MNETTPHPTPHLNSTPLHLIQPPLLRRLPPLHLMHPARIRHHVLTLPFGALARETPRRHETPVARAWAGVPVVFSVEAVEEEGEGCEEDGAEGDADAEAGFVGGG